MSSSTTFREKKGAPHVARTVIWGVTVHLRFNHKRKGRCNKQEEQENPLGKYSDECGTGRDGKRSNDRRRQGRERPGVIYFLETPVRIAK